MKVYNVSGYVSVLALSEDAALSVLREKAKFAGMDLYEEVVKPNMTVPGNGYIASGMVADLFEAASAEEAKEKFLHRISFRARLMPKHVLAFESEDVTEEWAR